jgi:hypothetical protein
MLNLRATKSFILISCLTPVSSLFPIQSVSAADTTDKEKLPCRIQISSPHISSNIFRKTGLRAVKVNAFSICNVPQSNVTLTVEIWKNGIFSNHFVFKTITRSVGTTSPGRKIPNYNTFKVCISFESTTYYGVAHSKTFINFKWQYARDTFSIKNKPLKCGT